VTSAPRLTLSPVEAATALGMSRDHFDRHVRDELRLIRSGRLVLVPVTELERWVEENAARTVAP
jgi:excisionase family DNA binding protein